MPCLLLCSKSSPPTSHVLQESFLCNIMVCSYFLEVLSLLNISIYITCFIWSFGNHSLQLTEHQDCNSSRSYRWTVHLPVFTCPVVGCRWLLGYVIVNFQLLENNRKPGFWLLLLQTLIEIAIVCGIWTFFLMGSTEFTLFSKIVDNFGSKPHCTDCEKPHISPKLLKISRGRGGWPRSHQAPSLCSNGTSSVQKQLAATVSLCPFHGDQWQMEPLPPFS